MGLEAVKVRREKIEACMKCPICNKLMKEATTISLCLHTFCRKCIYKKLSDEEFDCCPVCDIDLGCLPLEKLRPDHNLQDIRAKIFPIKGRKAEAPEVLLPATPQPKKKERLLSSLVLSAPEVSIQTGTAGRRTKALARKAASLRKANLALEESNDKRREDSSAEDAVPVLSSLDLPSNPKKRKESSPDETSNGRKPSVDLKNGTESKDDTIDPWNPLNCLVEAVNRTTSSKRNSAPTNLAEPTSGTKSSDNLETPNIPGGSVLMSRAKAKDVAVKTKPQEDNNGNSTVDGSGRVKRKRGRRPIVKETAASHVAGPSPQIILDASKGQWNGRNHPVWFSLVASKDKKGEVSLPQISAHYLMIKDSDMPVSLVQKYIGNKLQLTDESEVEILCRGQPVDPTLQLRHVVEFWFRTLSTSKMVTASIGTSAKDLIMILSYCRKSNIPET